MLINILLWIIISVFIGLVGYRIELNKGKNLLSNIVAAFLGVFISAFLVYFFFWPTPISSGVGEINPYAAMVALVFGFWAVKIEDKFFLRI